MKYFFLFGLCLLANSAQARIAQNYSDVKKFHAQIAKKYPNTTQLIQIGESDSGQAIEALKIGNGAMKNLVVATHHGNEYGSTEVALAFAESLAENPIKGQTVFIIPVLNIAGYNSSYRYERGENGNSSYHDPNRDYPGPCGSEGPFKLKSTKALANFIAKEEIVTSATLHTYYPAVVYPWGLSSRDLATPYPEIFTQLVKYATQESEYEIGNGTEVIYPADGTYEDYAFWQHGIWSILFELGFSHSPSEEQIKQMTEVNLPGIRRMLENAPMARAADHGFRGACDAGLKGLFDRHDE